MLFILLINDLLSAEIEKSNSPLFQIYTNLSCSSFYKVLYILYISPIHHIIRFYFSCSFTSGSSELLLIKRHNAFIGELHAGC